MEKIADNLCFEGRQQRYEHDSAALGCRMKFSLYLPPQAGAKADIPVLFWLSGLTCTDENFVHKAGAQRVAAQLGLAIVTPDTSPRGDHIPDAPDAAYDLGLGAGFYLNATQAPWKTNYRMYDYVLDELPALLRQVTALDLSRQSLAGHSMGGHGALVIGLRNPQRYKSISAFAPIVAPLQCPWGNKAFSNYLGDDRRQWEQYDASLLLDQASEHLPLLIDQGTADPFLEEQLKPQLLIDAAERNSYPLIFRERTGYDHSYFYIATFIEEHLRFHHVALSTR